MTKFICMMLLIMPWMFDITNPTPGQYRIPQLVTMVALFMGIISIFPQVGCGKKYKNGFLALFIGYFFANFFWRFFIPIYFRKDVVPMFMALSFMIFVLGVASTYICVSVLTRESFEKIAKTLCLSSVIVSVFVILQKIGLDPWASFAKYNCANKISACLDNPNLVGMYLAICSAMFLCFMVDKKYILGYALTGVGVFITKSNFACFVFLVTLSVYVYINWLNLKNLYVRLSAILGASVLAFIVYKTDFIKMSSDIGRRLGCWKLMFERVKMNSLFGHGLATTNTFPVRTEGSWGDAVWFQAHNDYLQFTAEIGLIGIALFLLVVWNSVRNFDFSKKLNASYFSMFVAFLIFMMASFPLEVPAVGTLGLVSFWAMESLCQKKAKEA